VPGRGLPLAYFIATRVDALEGPPVILLVIPFWTSFLIRTIAG
jgi:ABC-type spermidine/putrescine transport system permease subunit I